MKCGHKALKGSFTVEAACVMAMVLLALSVLIQQSWRIHDESVAAMGLHEAVEKGRHGTARELDSTAEGVQGHMGRLMAFSSCSLTLDGNGTYVYGKCHGGKWSREIEAAVFRPEIFMRKITLIEGLGGEDGS